MAESWVSTREGAHLRGRVKHGTEPEMLLRRALHALGCRYRVQKRLARGCTPDIIFSRARIAVFVDGDFWHGCPRHGRTRFSGPNSELWETKMARNRERDNRSTKLARELGYHVVRVWECEVRSDPNVVAVAIRDQIATAVKQ